MYTLTIKQCDQKFDSSNNPDDYDYQVVRIIRICTIAISSIALLINIAIIIKSKQYIYNLRETIYIYYHQIILVSSLLSVIPHDPSYNFGIFKKQHYPLFFHDLTECMVLQARQYKIAFMGLINFGCYTISYWFAICITMYIKLILQNNNKQFMKKKSMQIFSVAMAIVIWYIVPFLLTFYVNVPFSIGPAGYQYGQSFYFLSPGIVNRYMGTDLQDLGQGLAILWIYFWPICLFFYHLYLLVMNKKLLNKRQSINQITPRQDFLIQSGHLVVFIFIVQIILISKTLLNMLCQIQWHLIFIINILFDLLGLILLIMYLLLYYKQGINLQFKSQIKDKSLLQTFNDYGTNNLI